YTKSDGIWGINVPNLEFFMRSCAQADALLKNINSEFVAFGPNLTTVDSAAATLHEFYDRLGATQSGQILRELLVTMESRSVADDRAYLEKGLRAQKRTLYRGARSRARADGRRALHRKLHHEEGQSASSLTDNKFSGR